MPGIIKGILKVFYYGLALDVFARSGKRARRLFSSTARKPVADSNQELEEGHQEASPKQIESAHPAPPTKLRVNVVRFLEVPGYLALTALMAFYVHRFCSSHPVEWIAVLNSVMAFIVSLIFLLRALMMRHQLEKLSGYGGSPAREK